MTRSNLPFSTYATAGFTLSLTMYLKQPYTRPPKRGDADMIILRPHMDITSLIREKMRE